MKIIIRDAIIEDCERIRYLQEEIAELHHIGRPDLFKPEARYFTEDVFEERLNSPSNIIYIAETDAGEVVGYVFAWLISYRNHPTYHDFDNFYIDDICVSKKHQRCGIGKMLFERCRQDATERGCKLIDLGVYAFNSNAIEFYKSCGMRERIIRMEYNLEEQNGRDKVYL